MLRFIILIASASMLALGGCAKPFQPPPSTSTLWQKSGTSEDEIKRAMLECGYPTPFGADKNIGNNEIALMQLCMERSGFAYDKRLNTFCREFPRLQACQADALKSVPKREINRRLNSRYCINRDSSQSPACQ